MSQFHFDPATYLDLMRAEVPAYGRLQEAVAAVLERHGGAAAVGIDKDEAMLDAARARLHGLAVELVVAQLTDPLPPGPFDLVVSALAVHHLEGPDKAALFARVRGVVRPGGRFVLGDVVIPVDPADAVTPLTGAHDRPSTVADQLRWLAEAGFEASVVWSERDLVVLRADRPVSASPATSRRRAAQ